jgi:hypothetical protein
MEAGMGGRLKDIIKIMNWQLANYSPAKFSVTADVE